MNKEVQNTATVESIMVEGTRLELDRKISFDAKHKVDSEGGIGVRVVVDFSGCPMELILQHAFSSIWIEGQRKLRDVKTLELFEGQFEDGTTVLRAADFAPRAKATSFTKVVAQLSKLSKEEKDALRKMLGL